MDEGFDAGGAKSLQAKMNDLLRKQASYFDKRRRLDDPARQPLSTLSGPSLIGVPPPRPHRFFNRRIAELDEAASQLALDPAHRAGNGSALHGGGPAFDHSAYVRLLSSQRFDTQDLARRVRDLPHDLRLGTSTGQGRGKLQGSSIEGCVGSQAHSSRSHIRASFVGLLALAQ